MDIDIYRTGGGVSGNLYPEEEGEPAEIMQDDEVTLDAYVTVAVEWTGVVPEWHIEYSMEASALADVGLTGFPDSDGLPDVTATDPDPTISQTANAGSDPPTITASEGTDEHFVEEADAGNTYTWKFQEKGKATIELHRDDPPELLSDLSTSRGYDEDPESAQVTVVEQI
jgi:hypothetical protein